MIRIILKLAIFLAFSIQALPVQAEFNPTLRVLLYGDAGSGNSDQIRVGRAMAKRHEVVRYDFGLSLGDNWYSRSHDLSQVFEIPYASLISSGLILYQTLGNHDHQDGRNKTQLDYAKSNPSFGLPDSNYVISRPELKLIVVDVANARGTVNLTNERLKWLEEQLCSPQTEAWKALAIHYHIWGTGHRGDFKDLEKILSPLLSKCSPDFLLSGHEHHAEFMEPLGSMWISIHGNSGASARSRRSKSERKSLFYQLEKGFAEINLSSNEAEMSFFDTNVKKLFTIRRKKE